ncbi:MAG: 4-hydroxy-tetrahydrodipicolinate synthase [Christensenellales bacterium]|jgi:4-hydroxy-tetrahydrodipicolinate synthase
MFRGVGTALITPFTEEGIDFQALDKLITYQLEGGVDALIVLGTTGEPATMGEDERRAVIEFAIEKVNKKIPVIIGTGCNCTATAIKNSVNAEKLGADGLLVVTPYYNKATQGGLVAHYNAIADAVSIPIIVYNVPGRTGVNMLPKTFSEIAEHKNIAAMKEASGNIEQITEMCALTKGKAEVLSGDDAIILPVMAVGGKGVISVASNVLPAYVKSLTDAFFDGDLSKAAELQYRMNPLVKALFSEVNPIPVKKAAEILGLSSARMRLPLTEMTEDNAKTLEKLLKEFI